MQCSGGPLAKWPRNVRFPPFPDVAANDPSRTQRGPILLVTWAIGRTKEIAASLSALRNVDPFEPDP